MIPLRLNYEFSRVYRRGRFATGRYITVHCFKRTRGLKHNMTVIPININRIGFCANKKQLGAVGRNRARRLMREAYRHVAPDVVTGNDIVFTMRTVSELPSYDDVAKEMYRLMGKLRLFATEREDAKIASQNVDKASENVSEIHITGTRE